ncbi:unnamed protein product [[Actinomadura] parvosata subsp. kistnae]|uniref:TfoX N-terminal domain-containing protein n=2 Tax=Nonomuraea TaxID=83681 RepID=A0A1V0A0U4_9ACTN|nr:MULTISPECIES: hypothetical protein [unclassified Nonomuraea]AQZ63810.1 hypothetical protein BKM31_22195 [Nonomuraea sp. ATCC 55076]NJP98408.1 hypothetical protein [Nonomuraea sp. FMUSA5-5]SPL89631.1 unnamed protein product [Actinomadura parvosata subsp. kistnae]
MGAEEDFQRVGAELADLGVRISRMMGSPALKDRAGKVFASLQRDGAMVFRLVRDTPEHEAALRLDGASLFDPSGRGREMRDWVVVPHSSAEKWTDLAEAALSRPR